MKQTWGYVILGENIGSNYWVTFPAIAYKYSRSFRFIISSSYSFTSTKSKEGYGDQNVLLENHVQKAVSSGGFLNNNNRDSKWWSN